MIGVEKMLGSLPNLIGKTADELKQILMTAVLQKSPGDIERYSNVLGQLARARLAVLENRTDDTVDVEAVVPRFIYAVINTVVLLYPSGAAMGGVPRRTQVDTDLAYLAGVLEHTHGLAGLVESAELGQLTQSEKKQQKHSGSTRRGSAPMIYVREDDIGKKSSSTSARSPEGKAIEKKRNEKKSGGHDGFQNETGDSDDKPRSDGKSKKNKVKRVQSGDWEMGPPSPNYIVPAPPPASPSTRPPGVTMLPLTSSPLTAPPPYSPRENVDDASLPSHATTASGTSATSSTKPSTVTDQSHLAPVTSSLPALPRPTTLGSARHSMKMENLDQFMEKNIKIFVRDMGESGSSLMLRVVKKLPADYELTGSNSDALRDYARDAIQRADLNEEEMKELAGLNPRVSKKNVKVNQLGLMHLLIVDVAKGMRVPERELASVTLSPSQAQVKSLVTSLLANLNEMGLEALLNADLNQSDEDVLLVSARSPSPDGPLPGSSLASLGTGATPRSPSSAATPRVPVSKLRTKGTSVPPSPRSFSRESSGDGNTSSHVSSPRNLERSNPSDPGRTSTPVSRESSGSDLDDSVGETSGEKSAPPQTQRLRSASQLNLMQQSAPRKLTVHKRTNTAGPTTTPSNSPEKGSPNKPPESGQSEKQQ
ncbi:MAG: hypothetical protein JWR22_4043 [Herminiimonas sp.]|nr:hypothetical protein [Herminiimonas sp.]